MIRRATVADAPAIADIKNAMVRDTLVSFTTEFITPDQIASEIETKPYFVVAQQNDTVLGFALYDEFRGGPGYAHTVEHSLHVLENARGEGIGSSLMDHLELTARQANLHILVAGISSANPRSITFHARRGFVEVARMPEVGRKWDQWLDLILMQKTLT